MKTVKLKAANAITLAHPQAELGRTPSGAIVFEVRGIPDHVTLAQVAQRYTSFAGCYYGGSSFEWSS